MNEDQLVKLIEEKIIYNSDECSIPELKEMLKAFDAQEVRERIKEDLKSLYKDYYGDSYNTYIDLELNKYFN